MNQADALAAGACLLAGYLAGGIPFGYAVARARGVDIRAVGSGNIGATNVGRALGRRWGTLVLVLDIAKGFLPTFFLAEAIAGWIGAEENLNVARTVMGLGTILGHVFTPYLLFRGGKGVATSIGVFVALIHWWMALPLALYLIVRKATGFVSAGSVTLAAALPAAAYVHCRDDLARAWPVVAFAGLAGAIIIIRHASNIARLVRGTEHAAPAAAEDAGPRPEEQDR